MLANIINHGVAGIIAPPAACHMMRLPGAPDIKSGCCLSSSALNGLRFCCFPLTFEFRRNFDGASAALIGNPIMILTLVLAIPAFAAMMPAFAQAKHGETPPTNPKSTLAQVQKVIQIIRGDKVKTQQFCDVEKLDPQIAEAVQKNDPNKLEALIKQADDLAQKIGPEYVMMMEGLAQIDENSREGKQIADALDSLVKLCATK
jgi:hypothetical protein